MAKLELSTNELAKILTSYVSEEISNVKGEADGISFDIELQIPLLPNNIPIKFAFYKFDYDNQQAIFTILLNSNSRLLVKAFDKIVKVLPKYFSDENLPDGVELSDGYLYVSPTSLLDFSDYEILFTDLSISSKKVVMKMDII
jgi:hypothetical protein